jgi:ankyrin repeat protein/mannosyltransferase OCH1-like enzyme
MFLGCYETEMEEIFLQEGIDYANMNMLHSELSVKKLASLNDVVERTKVPAITHQIFVTDKNSSSTLNKIAVDKTILSLTRLNQLGKNFKHIIWTNQKSIIPQEILAIEGIFVESIELFKDHSTFYLIEDLLTKEDKKISDFTQASDLIRYLALQTYGGIYRDLDYEIYQPKELLKLMLNFDFFGGKEFSHYEPVYITSSIIGCIKDHPIIKKTLALIERNLSSAKEKLPEYLQFPCDAFNQQIYSTGPAVLTMAFFLKANQAGFNDIMLPGDILSNWQYANSITPESRCHKQDQIVEFNPKTIGADLFCGDWHKENSRFYYKKNIDIYLYIAAQNGNLNMAKRTLQDGANPNLLFNYTKVTPLYIATQNNHEEVVKELLEHGASIWFKSPQSISILELAYKSNNPKIIEFFNKAQQKLLDQTEIGCFQGDIEDIFIQEDVDYKKENSKLINHTKLVYGNILEPNLIETDFKNQSKLRFYQEKNQKPIEFITHQIFFSINNSTISPLLIDKTIKTLTKLNQADEQWQHYIWLNNFAIIPENLKNLSNVELHYLNELNHTSSYFLIGKLFESNNLSLKLVAQMTDIARLMILYEFGGIYRDFDYEIYQPDELIAMLKAYNFIAGKERNTNISFIGNSFMAANKKHPIIDTALNQFIYRNLFKNHNQLPLYLKYPCSESVKVIYQTGSPVITLAYFQSANLDNNVDIVMPAQSFYNIEYARATSPLSHCYKPLDNPDLKTNYEGQIIQTIGADLFCGSWYSDELIKYLENHDIYLYLAAQEGNLKEAEIWLKMGANPNNIRVNSVSPLAVAAQKEHLEIVKLLINNGADIDFSGDGYTPLYRSIQSRNYEIAQYLIAHGANVDSIQANKVNILFYSAYKNYPEMVQLLLHNDALTDFEFNGGTAKEYAQRHSFIEVVNEFTLSDFIKAVRRDNLENVQHLIDSGFAIDTKHQFNTTALYYSCLDGHVEMTKLLLKNGANPNIAIISGDTPLYVASSKGHLEIVKLLIEAGANIEAKVDGKNTALFIAAHNHHKDVVALLLEKGAKILDIGHYPIFIVQEFQQNKTDKAKEIHNILVDTYLNRLNVTLENNEQEKPGEFEVVVARYEEDVSWLRKEFPYSKIKIYNKGQSNPSLLANENITIIYLPNIGREAHTYLTHIIENYDNLANRTLFIQGHPYEHPLFLPLYKFKYYNHSGCNNIIGFCTESISIKDREESINQQIVSTQFHLKNYQTFSHFVQNYINPNIDNSTKFSSINGAQFVTEKQTILNKPKSYYKNLIKNLNTSHPLEGYYFERTWDIIFEEFKTDNPTNLNNDLFFAVNQGDLAKVKKLVALGADINFKHPGNYTVLFLSVHNNNLEIAEYLLANGAQTDVHHYNGATPLHSAAISGNIEIVKLLLKYNANPEALFNKHVVINGAIQYENTEIVKLLLDYGVNIYHDFQQTPMLKAAIARNNSPKSQEISLLVFNYYFNQLKQIDLEIYNSTKTFEVVIVRYKEDLSWINNEFKTEKIIIYNKGEDDLYNLPVNCEVRNIPNLGFLGGTYLYHIVNNYHNLADRTLFLQGFPYDQEVFLPMVRHKQYLKSNCKNIIAKCEDTSIEEQASELSNYSEEDWQNSKYSAFKPIKYDIKYFAHNFVNPSLNIKAPLKMALGAQMAVDKEKIYCHDLDYYSAMLKEFNDSFPRQDFFLEKLWDEVFACYQNNIDIITNSIKEMSIYEGSILA